MELIEKQRGFVQHRVLLISANPYGVQRELIAYEAQQIKTVSAGTAELSNLVVTPATIGSDDELEKLLQEVRPTILQISGAASPNGSLMLRSNRGRIRSLTGRNLVDLIRSSQVQLECVFMSGHSVARQLGVLQEVAKTVISIRCKQYSFDYSLLVSGLFYTHLSAESSFQDVFNQVKSTIHRLGIASLYASRLYAESTSQLKVARSVGRGAIDSKGNLLGTEPNFDLPVFSRSVLPSAPVSPVPERVSQADDKDRLYQVWYGTNRKPVLKNGVVVDYTDDRATRTSYGVCDVKIPKHHKIGSVGSSWWQRFPRFWEDDNILFKRVRALDDSIFWDLIGQNFKNQSVSERVLLIYVHGYKTTFQDAAVRTAQLGVDLSVKGAAAFFSWPSKGHLMGYAADGAAVEASEGALCDFILQMANLSGADKVHLIAHSMGNRGVLRAFTRAVDKVSHLLQVPLGQVFLAAPDVDVDLFTQLAHVYPKLADRTTLYVSKKDKALLSSGILHDYPRAGYVPPVTVVNDVDTIEVTSIDLTFLGHGYVAEAKSVLTDMHQLMESGTPPSRRFGLEELFQESGLRYWRLKA